MAGPNTQAPTFRGGPAQIVAINSPTTSQKPKMNYYYGRFILGYIALACLLYGCTHYPVDVGWRDKATEPDKTPSSSVLNPSRPILYFGLESGELVIRAIHPDGRSVGTLASGRLAGWSRQGDLFAYLAEDKASKEIVVNVMGPGGQPRTLFKAGPKESVYLAGWQSIWSPDGRRIALLVDRAPMETFALVIVEIEKKKVDQWFELPKSAYTQANWAPYNLKWSPDGSKVLIAWEQTIVLDVASGAVETIVAKRAMAEWMPGSDGVYYFDEWFSIGNLVFMRIGQKEVVKVLDSSQLDDWGMHELVLFHTPILKLSPNGTRLAMQAGNTVLVFDVETNRASALRHPPTRLQVEGAIAAIEWGPDEKKLAILAGLKKGLALGVLDLESGAWRTLDEQVVQLRGTQVDVLGLMNTISWAP